MHGANETRPPALARLFPLFECMRIFFHGVYGYSIIVTIDINAESGQQKVPRHVETAEGFFR